MLKIALAQFNLTTGAIVNNTKKIIEAIITAEQKHHATAIIFPELSICGYLSDDLLLRREYQDTIAAALQEIVQKTGDIYVFIGHPWRDNEKQYNACSLIHQGKIQTTYYKQQLPNYDVFDEKRYFDHGTEHRIFEINGNKIAITICEDIWHPQLIKSATQSGAEIIFNLSASPYHYEQQKEREALLTEQAQQHHVTIVYTNLVGGQDELIFDGRSTIIDSQANIIFQAPAFKEGLFIANLEHPQTQSKHPIKLDSHHTRFDKYESIYNALILGTHDYVKKNGFQEVLIGLSGGIDSALTSYIAADALGATKVEGIIMPSRYTEERSINDAIALAKNLDINWQIISIEALFNQFVELLAPIFQNMPTNATEENIQARCRAIILMAIANKKNKLVLSTGNKSELAVGYTTLYGDMAGSFAPIKDIWKTEVYQLAHWINQQKAQKIPQSIIEREPTAELRENQTDQDTLPPYETLDSILIEYILNHLSPDQIVAKGFSKKLVKDVIQRLHINEYKRQQAPLGPRISKRSFGRGWRYPLNYHKSRVALT